MSAVLRHQLYGLLFSTCTLKSLVMIMTKHLLPSALFQVFQVWLRIVIEWQQQHCYWIANTSSKSFGHFVIKASRVQLKCDGTWCRTAGEVKGKLANGMGSQYPSHYLGTQHYYCWCAHLGRQQFTERSRLFAERRNLVSGPVPSHFKRSLLQCKYVTAHVPRVGCFSA